MTKRGRKIYTVDGLSRVVVEERADAFLMAHQPSALESPRRVDILQLCELAIEDHGYHLEVTDDLEPGLLAYTSVLERAIVLGQDIYEGLDQPGDLIFDGRSRFTAAHELGHMVLHGEQLRNIRFRNHEAAMAFKEDIPAYRNCEWQANAFAAALLMPRVMVEAVLNDRICQEPFVARYRLNGEAKEDVWAHRVAFIFGVSLEAAKRRMSVLISDRRHGITVRGLHEE